VRFPRHARILLFQVEASKWIWVTPTLDVQYVDLARHTFRAVPRNTRYPPGDPIFTFGAVTDATMIALRAEGRAVAELLGLAVVGPVAPRDAIWIYADTSSERFSQEVSLDLFGDVAGSVLKGSKGMVRTNEVPEVWDFIERILPGDKEAWIDDKRSGAGRDPRLSTTVKLKDGTRRTSLRDALESFRPVVLPGWVFRGPPAIREVVSGIVQSGLEPQSYHSHWTTTSGISPASGIAREHGFLLTLLWMMACYDQYDLFNSAVAEAMGRRILMIQRATKRSPKNPDFSGLECFLLHQLDPSAGIVAADFDKYIAELQKVESNNMKQARLSREEQEAINKAAKQK
jgi:hypothetical protein